MPNITEADEILRHASPVLPQRGHETQPYGHLVKRPIALDESTCRKSVASLNQLLADTIAIRDMYKKHHWQVAGHTLYPLQLLFDKHAKEQTSLVDGIAERIQLLGGVCIAMSHDVAEMTLIPRPAKGREPVPVQISRLLHAHEIVLRGRGRWQDLRPTTEMTARTTCWSAMSFGPMNCRCGLSPNTSWIHRPQISGSCRMYGGPPGDLLRDLSVMRTVQGYLQTQRYANEVVRHDLAALRPDRMAIKRPRENRPYVHETARSSIRHRKSWRRTISLTLTAWCT